jgi:hypothetical protein
MELEKTVSSNGYKLRKFSKLIGNNACTMQQNF